jgi:asparagine synthase (glutamine-hydrolysing)
MLTPLKHEVWYKSGSYASDELFTYIGWTNHGGEFSDCLPIYNESKDCVLILTGEIFHDPDVIKNLKNKGHRFLDGDGNYLIHQYEERRENFFLELNGLYAGILIDYHQKKVYLFNDRYGMHRLFLYEGKDGFYFSSEAKALLAVLPSTRQYDMKGLGEYLTCGCTLGDRSLYKNINILPSASIWEFEDGAIKTKKKYFDSAKWTEQGSLDKEHFSARLVELVGSLVKRYSAGRLPVGISLTGGLDSRIIMACLDTRFNKYPCYTFGSMYRDTFDVKIAKEVAKKCGQPHHVLELNDRFLRELPLHLERAVYISDGYIGLSGAAELYLNSMARSIAPVRLTGNYGDEIMRGHRAFTYYSPKGDFITPDLKPFLSEAQLQYQFLQETDAISCAAFRLAPSQNYGRLAIERSQLTIRTPFLDDDLVKLFYQVPDYLLKNDYLSLLVINMHNSDLLKIETDRGNFFTGSPLRKLAKRMYCEALFKAEYWASHGMPSWLAASTNYGLKRFLEKQFIGRHKFQHFRIWLQKDLAEYLKDMLLQGNSGLPEYFNHRNIERIVNDHISGYRNYINEIDILLILTLIQKKFLGYRASDLYL